jgi:hypothetical protein
VRVLISTVIVVCELSAALADEMDLPPPSIRLEFHEAIRTEYHFVARPLPELAPPPAWSTRTSLVDLPPPASETAVEPEVVRMPAVIVRGDADFRTIDSALRSQAASTGVRKSYSRLGIGPHELRWGKASLYVITVFYVPIAAGISW